VGSLIDTLRSGPLGPSHFPYRRFGLAVLIGLAGGALFSVAQLPLPWMLGAMTACTLAALLRAPVQAPSLIRPPMSAIIGVMLGSGFSPSILTNIGTWVPTLVGLIIFMIACGVTVVAYFRKVGGFDWTTSFFSGMPGGLVEMVTYGEERGGDARVIALVHSSRILMVVLALPFAIQWIEGVAINRGAGAVSIVDTPLATWLWLIICAVVGVYAGRLLRLPASVLLGPMLASALVHLFGLSDFKPPFEVINVAQLVLGIVIGCRFAGTASATVLRILALSVGSTIILLAWMTGFAYVVSRFSTYDMESLVLAYSPGGLAEMSLIAVSLHAEVAFVAAHHVVRVFLVMISAPLVFRFIGRRAQQPPSSP
jgi:membrane AbrB-like protein